MTTTRRLEISTVYSIERHRPTAVRVPPIRALALLSLATAGGWIYVTWYPIDRYLARQMVKVTLHQPITIDWSAWFRPPPPELAIPPDSADPAARPVRDPPDEAAIAAANAESEATLRRLSYDMYVWLTITTFVASWLALSGGAGLAQWASSPSARRGVTMLALMAGIAAVGLGGWMWSRGEAAGKPPPSTEIALVAAVTVLGGALCARSNRTGTWAALVAVAAVLMGLVVPTWLEYRWGWPVLRSRSCILLILAFSTMLGVLLAHRAERLHRTAAALVAASSLATLIAMGYASAHGGFLDQSPPLGTYAAAFAIQSAYAWLVPLARLAIRMW